MYLIVLYSIHGQTPLVCSILGARNEHVVTDLVVRTAIVVVDPVAAAVVGQEEVLLDDEWHRRCVRQLARLCLPDEGLTVPAVEDSCKREMG